MSKSKLSLRDRAALSIGINLGYGGYMSLEEYILLAKKDPQSAFEHLDDAITRHMEKIKEYDQIKEKVEQKYPKCERCQTPLTPSENKICESCRLGS